VFEGGSLPRLSWSLRPSGSSGLVPISFASFIACGAPVDVDHAIKTTKAALKGARQVRNIEIDDDDDALDILDVDWAVLRDFVDEDVSQTIMGVEFKVSNPGLALIAYGESAMRLAWEGARTALIKYEKQLRGEALAEPERWEKFDDPAHDSEVFQVKEGTNEFQDIHDILFKDFGDRADKIKITKIERVQNKGLWRKFANQRLTIARIHKGYGKPWEKANETDRWLVHGTGDVDPEVVATSCQGIFPNFSERGLYGRGSYFAVRAGYSDHNYRYSVPGTNEHKLIIARVTLGTEPEVRTKRDEGITHPKRGHHCVQAEVGNPGARTAAYVLYEQFQSYPDYIITYTRDG